MKTNNLIIGLGTSGSNIIDSFPSYFKDIKNLVSICFHSYEGNIYKNVNYDFNMSSNLTLGDICDLLGNDTIDYLFPNEEKDGISFLRNLRMDNGSNSFRLKGLLFFIYFLSIKQNKTKLINAFSSIVNDDEECQYNVYIVSSLCGGTGSALILPLSMYIKKIFKEEFKKPVQIIGLFSCPDIYINNFSSNELNQKKYANAYATIKEINAVNLIANDCNYENNLSKINFKIGDKNEPILGLLFDSNDSKFHQKEFAPFTKCYLFDRVYGEKTISSHEQLIRNSLYALLKGYAVSNDNNHYFGCLSFSEIRYAKEELNNYVINKFAFDSIEKNLLVLSKGLNQYLLAQQKIYKQENRRMNVSPDSTKFVIEYINSLSNEYTNNYSNTGFSSVSNYALNRENDIFTPDLICKEKMEAYGKEFSQFIFKQTSDESSYNDLKTQLYEICGDKSVKPIHLLDSDDKKSLKIEELEKRAKKYFELLNKSYQKKINWYKEQRSEFIDLLLSKDNNEVSFVNNFLMENGEFINPIIGYVRLSYLKNNFETRLKSLVLKSKEFEALTNKETGNIFYRFLLLKDFSSYKESEYSQKDEKRLSNYALRHFPVETLSYLSCSTKDYLDNTDTPLHNPKYDDIALIEDMLSIYKEFCKQLYLFFYKEAYLLLDKTINGYKKMFDCFEQKQIKFKEEVDYLYKNGSTSNKFVVNLGATQNDKNKQYLSFVKELYSLEPKIDISDSYFGNAFFDAAIHLTNDADVEKYTKDITLGMVELANNFYLKSSIFSNTNEKFILNVLQDSIKEQFETTYLINCYDTLRLNREDIISKTVKKLYISKENFANLINENPSLIKLDKFETYLNDLVDKDFNVNVVEGLDNQKIYVGMQNDTLDPLNIMLMDELNTDSLFTQCDKALLKTQAYKTAMWNPYIYNLNYDYYLPMISSRKEKDEIMVYTKAFVYLLIKKIIKPIHVDDSDSVYMSINNDEPLKFMGEFIKFEDYKSLFNYLRVNRFESKKLSDNCDLFLNEINENVFPITNELEITDFVNRFVKIFNKFNLVENNLYKLNQKMIHNILYFAYNLNFVNDAFCEKLGESIVTLYFNTLNNLVTQKTGNLFPSVLVNKIINTIVDELNKYREYDNIKSWLKSNKNFEFDFNI